MLSRGHQAAGRHRKCGPENEAENRPEICPARRFHRQCVEPIWGTDLGVDRRFNFFLPTLSDALHRREEVNARQHWPMG